MFIYRDTTAAAGPDESPVLPIMDLIISCGLATRMSLHCRIVRMLSELSDEDEHVGVCLRAVPERSYRGETFGCLGEVTEQRKLCGVIEVLEVPERVFTACISVYTQFIMKWSFL